MEIIVTILQDCIDRSYFWKTYDGYLALSAK